MRILQLKKSILFCLFICFSAHLFADGSERIERACSCIDGGNFRIEVDLQQQLVRVFQNDNLVKEMPCSSGRMNTPTPVGSFETYEKIENNQWLDSDGNEISYYYFTKFNGHIGFHSKIFGNSSFVEEGERRFEEHKPSSMGCVRLLLSDAKWLYDEISLGVKVDVHQ